MSYQRAEDVLPIELIEILQKYVDGEYLYIPRKSDNKKKWGSSTKINEELNKRNHNIVRDYMSGKTVKELSADYFLSVKSIQRILLKYKSENIEIKKAI